MKSDKSATNGQSLLEPPNFSLVLGGPLFQLMRRAHLSDDALELLRKRIVVITLLTWLPLLLLSAMEGHAWGGSIAVPFLRDLEVHIRFLVAIPLLIEAEYVVHKRMLPLVRQFLERELIPEDARPQFDEAVAAASRLRNSLLAEVLMITFVYGFGVLFLWRHFMVLNASTWFATPSSNGSSLSLAGIWYGYLSVPFFQFLLCRWYFRIFVWARFLWQVSRIKLKLVPTHPDRLGGLGFLPNIVFAFAPLAAAHGVMVSGMMANRILHLGAKLPEFKVEVALMLVFLLCLILVPLMVFVPQLAEAKRTGLREYGVLAQRYVREFDSKWLRGGAPADEPFVGTGDIQSLADLGNSFEIVRTMRIFPLTKEILIQTSAAALLPILPLALTMMSLEELLKKLLGIFL